MYNVGMLNGNNILMINDHLLIEWNTYYGPTQITNKRDYVRVNWFFCVLFQPLHEGNRRRSPLGGGTRRAKATSTPQLLDTPPTENRCVSTTIKIKQTSLLSSYYELVACKSSGFNSNN